MLAVESLGFGYHGRAVGRDVSFALEPGEVACLLGPNGSGKTTLFKTLLGLVPRQAGRVTLGGEDIAGWPRRRMAQRIGYVPQSHGAIFPFTVRQIVLMGRTARIAPFALPGRADHAAAEAALASLGIAHLADRILTEISGGERQLALLARALAQEPEVLVMDEPTASLDFGNQVRVLERINGLARSGLAVVLSTHDPDHAFLCGDRAILMHGGRVVASGRPEEVVTAANLKLLYGVDVAVAWLPELGRHACIPSLNETNRRLS
jgi:iron complex transport system ATP-binding protein